MNRDYERVRRELGLEGAFEAAVRDARALAAENSRLLERLAASAEGLTACEDQLATARANQAAQHEEINRLVQSLNDWQQAAKLWESNALSLLDELKRHRTRPHEPPRFP